MKTFADLVKKTLNPARKNKISYTLNGVELVRTYKRNLKVPHAFSTLDLLKDNISSLNILMSYK